MSIYSYRTNRASGFGARAVQSDSKNTQTEDFSGNSNTRTSSQGGLSSSDLNKESRGNGSMGADTSFGGGYDFSNGPDYSAGMYGGMALAAGLGFAGLGGMSLAKGASLGKAAHAKAMQGTPVGLGHDVYGHMTDIGFDPVAANMMANELAQEDDIGKSVGISDHQANLASTDPGSVSHGIGTADAGVAASMANSGKSDFGKAGGGGTGGGDGGGCFITTAVMHEVTKADDCVELEVLRWFRDNIMQSSETGQKRVAEYYEIAPSIVCDINARPDAGGVWKGVYKNYILPSVIAVSTGSYVLAEVIYTEMLNRLKNHSERNSHG